VCEKHGYISGEHEFCPMCDEELLKEHQEIQRREHEQATA